MVTKRLAGLLEESEKQEFEEKAKKMTKVYWLPLVWASAIVIDARREKLIEADGTMKGCLDVLMEYRRKLDKSLHIECINVPLVYSQVRLLSGACADDTTPFCGYVL